MTADATIKKLRIKFFIVMVGIVGILTIFSLISVITDEPFRTHDRFVPMLIRAIISSGIAIAVWAGICWFLSKRIVKPTKESLEKQKRFISEASHELKTPITVISAIAELLQQKAKDKQSKQWAKEILEQTDRMGIMATKLLTLANLDEGKQEIEISDFDLSSTVLNAVLTFEPVAFEQGKTFAHEIQENITHKGDPKSVTQAIEILCENAIKHSANKAAIKVNLTHEKSRTVLVVSNTGGNINKSEIPLLFERFYRGDDARAQTQGAGLGLAILKSLADQNRWTIKTDIKDGQTNFIIIF